MNQVIISLIFISLALSSRAQTSFMPGAFEPGLEFTLGYGAITSLTDIFESNKTYPSFEPDNLRDSYKHKSLNTGTINLGITYRVKKWLELSSTINYIGKVKHYSYKIDNALLRKEAEHYIGITPEVRFVWFRSGSNLINLYSSLGIGAGAVILTNTDAHNSGDSRLQFRLSGKVIPVGIKIGRGKIYGFGEAGIATTGIVAAGVGYRFSK